MAPQLPPASPEPTSHSLTVPSSPAEATKALSGEKATPFTSPSWPLSTPRAGWHEVQPVECVRRTARRLLRAHPLRAADALQLAAAIAASEHEPSSMPFLSLDDCLIAAAAPEGLDCVAVAR